jgi:hypothetical protein
VKYYHLPWNAIKVKKLQSKPTSTATPNVARLAGKWRDGAGRVIVISAAGTATCEQLPPRPKDNLSGWKTGEPVLKGFKPGRIGWDSAGKPILSTIDFSGSYLVRGKSAEWKDTCITLDGKGDSFSMYEGRSYTTWTLIHSDALPKPGQVGDDAAKKAAKKAAEEARRKAEQARRKAQEQRRRKAEEARRKADAAKKAIEDARRKGVTYRVVIKVGTTTRFLRTDNYLQAIRRYNEWRRLGYSPSWTTSP